MTISYVNNGEPMYVKGYTPSVKRRIYLFQDIDSVRVIALGFRHADATAIQDWATGGETLLNLDIDPSEVDVRWISPANPV